MKIRSDAYCTLFDVNYVDKGLVMAESMLKVLPNLKLYILCMDNDVYRILKSEDKPGIVLINLDDFLDAELLAIRGSRGRGEFCWSCTGKLIKYVLTHDITIDTCTYIDADMFFYSNPTVLIDEMVRKFCTVQVIPHRFPEGVRKRIGEKNSGKNCVEFNTFTRSEDSLKLLDLWISQCMNECSVKNGGDQKYISEWGEYSFVNTCENIGAGVAPWNVARYRCSDLNQLILVDKKTGERSNVVFYHFESIDYVSREIIRVHAKDQAMFTDDSFIDTLYGNYLVDIENVKRYLYNKYQWDVVYTHEGIIRSRSHVSILKKIVLLFKDGIRSAIYNVKNIALRKLKAHKTTYALSSLIQIYKGKLNEN